MLLCYAHWMGAPTSDDNGGVMNEGFAFLHVAN